MHNQNQEQEKTGAIHHSHYTSALEDSAKHERKVNTTQTMLHEHGVLCSQCFCD